MRLDEQGASPMIDLKCEAWEADLLHLEEKSPEEQESFLELHADLVQLSTLHALAAAIHVAFRADIPRALRLAEVSLRIARRLQNNRECGLALRAKANALSLTGKSKEALTLFEEAAAIFSAENELEETGRTLSTSIRSYLLLGDYDGAFEAASRARDIFDKLGEPARIARLDINVANIYHRQNRFAKALELYTRAYEQLLPQGDVEAIAVALHNVGVCRIALDDFQGALEAYQRLRCICESHEMPLLVAQADYNCAYLHFLRGDFTQSLALLQSTREIYQKNNDEYHLGLCDLDQAEIYIELGLSEEAVEMAQSSHQRFSRLGSRFEIGRSLAYTGIALAQGEHYAPALDAFETAKRTFLEENNLAWPSLLDLSQSLALFKQGKLNESERLCRPTLDCFRTAAMQGKELQALLLLSRISLQKGSLADAVELSRQALDLVRELELPGLGFQAWLLEGEIQEALGDELAAKDAYERCRETLETLRGKLHADELKIGLMKDRVKVYERLVTLSLKGGGEKHRSAEHAFRYIEEARSRSLRDLVSHQTDYFRKHAVEANSDREVRLTELRKNLNWYYHRIEREQLSKEGLDRDQLIALRQHARLQERELLRLEREEPQIHDCHEDGSASGSRTSSLEEVNASLRPGAVLVEYYATGDDLLAAVISRGQLQVVPLGKIALIQHHMRLLDFQMKKFGLGREYWERFRQHLLQSTRAHLRSLYQDLIQPLAPLLKGEHLVIIPWGLLHELPFHALLKADRYLIEDFSISYSPSASIYSLKRSTEREPVHKSLVIAVDSETTPFVRSEAISVAEAVAEPELLLGGDATEANLRMKGPHCNLIHIATHGHFRRDNPMFSFIRLADSYLSLHDLYHMELPVDLLTLSGCVTGANAVTGGDELIGLTRGLLFAGANSLLLSLWDLEDQSSSEFMGLFYRTLRREPRKAVALQSAMIQFLPHAPHPYFWAPFKLTSTAQSELSRNLH